jgi:uncharacterized protein YjbI with pentapeptide repeats
MAPLFQRPFAVDDEEERPKAASATGAETAKPQEGLIPASHLPSAADTLAQLFAETAGTEAPAAEQSAPPAAALKPEPANPPAEAAPRKRGLLARVFAFKRAQKAATEASASAERAAEARASETVVLTTVVAATEASNEGAGAAVGEQLTLAEIPENSTAPSPAVEAPISAEELPSAADVLQDLFPPEQTSGIAQADVSAAAGEEIENKGPEQKSVEVSEEHPVEVPVYTSVAATAEFGQDAAVDSAAQDQARSNSPQSSADEPPRESSPPGEKRHPEISPAVSGEIERGLLDRVVPGLERPAGATVQGMQDHANVRSSLPSEDEACVEESIEPEASKPASVLTPPQRLYKDWALDEKLASHGEWVESHGQTGQRADLSGAELEASDLISVNLRLADLHDANLRASDMLLADLRDACLVRADLEESCLVGANLEGANLEGASLETAMGLVPRQFAGANLRDALLAPHLMEFDAVTAFERESKNAFRYFWMMSAASVLSCLMIAKTRDAQLLTDSAIIPFLHSHAAATALPTAELYLIAPVAVFVLYVLFHFHLQRLWDSVVELPAIFPDGHMLGDRGPGIITGLLRTHFRWMNPDPSSTRLVEKSASLAGAYWIVPGTLLLFWARYLTRQEIHGTVLQALLATAAVGVATYATLKVGRPQERWTFENNWAQRAIGKIKAINPVSLAATLGALLLLLSAGVVFGVPHDRNRAPQFGAANIRRWAPDAFWWLAYDPYPDLTEASISRRPAGWNGSDEQVGSVEGLRANNAKFRYAQAYGSFFANGHLWRADFQGAFLSESDFRGADLGQSNMRYAVMDHAQMTHANFDRSNLDGADMRRADLRDANLSYCSLENTILVDARLDGASFYTARLPGADLTRAILEKADLRESLLVGAHMDHADLRSAYLWSARLRGADLGGAHLEGAILIDADLQGANLGGAQLTGTVLNGADLGGTSLEGADLRGALGLSVNQVCSAKSRRGAVLDPDMETGVDAQCGKQ